MGMTNPYHCDSGKRKGDWEEREEARFSWAILGDETNACEQKGVMQRTGIKLWITDQEEKYDVDGNKNGKKATGLYQRKKLCTCITLSCTFLSRRCTIPTFTLPFMV